MTFPVDRHMPALMTSFTTGSGTTPPVAINVRGDASIAWPAYSGPLKFSVAK